MQRNKLLFISLLGLLVQVANAQRAIAALGSKLKRFGGKSTNGKYIVEGENKALSYYDYFLGLFQDTVHDWEAAVFLVCCAVLGTIYLMAASSITPTKMDEGEWPEIILSCYPQDRWIEGLPVWFQLC